MGVYMRFRHKNGIISYSGTVEIRRFSPSLWKNQPISHSRARCKRARVLRARVRREKISKWIFALVFPNFGLTRGYRTRA